MIARAPEFVVAVAIVPVCASAIWLAVTSEHVERPAATALYRSYVAVVPMLIGLYWWRRRPASRFGPFLVMFGITAWVVSWQSSDWPPAFDLGVLAEAPYTILTFYLFLAFPSGRLETVADRVLIGGWAVVLFGFFVPWALGSPVIAGGGPLSGCVPACPENVLQIGSAPEVVDFLGRWETYLGLVVTVAVLAVYAARLRGASRPRRRALIAVAASSLLFLPVFFTYHFSDLILKLDPGTLQTMSWVVIGARILLPLGFLAALFQADLFAGVARGRLLEELVSRPSPERWRDAVARALDDPALGLAYWDLASGRFRQPDGDELTAPTAGDRAWIEVEHKGQPLAALVIDAALAEDPELVRAATSATVLAVASGNLEGERRDSRARIVAAGDAERHRIERDLHDSTQQRLLALRINLALASERIDHAEHRMMVEQLGEDVEATIDELRNVARGIYPGVLRQGGIAAALDEIARHAAMPVSIENGLARRYPDEIELAIYFACLEALQNAAKHAGPGSSASVRLTEGSGWVRFTVEDDGLGFDPESASRGAGLDNIAERISAVGGTLRVASTSGEGTRITGQLPA